MLSDVICSCFSTKANNNKGTMRSYHAALNQNPPSNSQAKKSSIRPLSARVAATPQFQLDWTRPGPDPKWLGKAPAGSMGYFFIGGTYSFHQKKLNMVIFHSY